MFLTWKDIESIRGEIKRHNPFGHAKVFRNRILMSARLERQGDLSGAIYARTDAQMVLALFERNRRVPIF